MMWYDTIRYDVIYVTWYMIWWHDMIYVTWYMIWYMIWYDKIYDVIWHGKIWCDICDMIYMIWHDTIRYDICDMIYNMVRKLDANNLTKTKNWSGRNEVTETSGRLHPLWPQNKRLYTPRTADYRHIRPDRWIQTELASTLATNATKPNPFEIIPLQTARKENNWKTEEALERAVVVLETERIEGSNPWCLWWWYICHHACYIYSPSRSILPIRKRYLTQQRRLPGRGLPATQQSDTPL